SIVVHWIDLFTRKELKHIVVNALKHCQSKKGLVIHAWCLMPSHLHMIVSSVDQKLSNIFRDFKKYTPASARLQRVK
ncbi:MAG: transposase, partial [Bacteroidota bacterium]